MTGSKPQARQQFAAILRVELLQLVRDKRALFAAIVLPVLLYPWLFAGQKKIEKISQESLASRSLSVAYDFSALPEPWEAPIWEALAAADPVEWVPVDAQAARTLEEERTSTLAEPESAPDPVEAKTQRRQLYEQLVEEPQVLLVVAHASRSGPQRPEISIYFDVKQDESREAQSRIAGALRDLEEARTQALREELLGGDPAAFLALETVDIASAEERSGANLGRLLPMLLVLLLISGGAFAALTVFAGEREAGTLESILVQPISPRTLAFAKYTAVAVAAFATLLANLGALYLCVAMGWTGDGAGGGMDGLRVTRLVGALGYLPGALLLCGLLCMALGHAKTFREGQYLLFPITLLAAIPSAVVLQPSLPNNAVLSAIPFTGPALVLRDILRGDVQLLHFVVMTVSHLLWVAWTLRRLGGMLEGERALASTSEARRLAKQGPARHGMRWGFAGVLAFYLVGYTIQARIPTWGVAYSMWGLLPPLALLCAWRARRTWAPWPGEAQPARFSLAAELGLRPGRWSVGLGALLLVPAMTLGMQHFLTWQESLLPLPQFMQQAAGLETMLSELSTVQMLFLMALTPAICEELFFRGAVFSSLRRGLSTGKALLWQTLFFAAAHGSVHRILPTAILGLLLGLLTLRARALWPAMLFHFAYNASQVLQATGELPAQSGPEAHSGHQQLAWLALVGFALVFWPQRSQASRPMTRSAQSSA